MRDVAAINLRTRFAVGDDDAVGKVTNLFDAHGDETDEPSEAAAAVVKWPDGTWDDVDLSKFDFNTRNH